MYTQATINEIINRLSDARIALMALMKLDDINFKNKKIDDDEYESLSEMHRMVFNELKTFGDAEIAMLMNND